jgi:hypothetical protein
MVAITAAIGSFFLVRSAIVYASLARAGGSVQNRSAAIGPGLEPAPACLTTTATAAPERTPNTRRLKQKGTLPL